MSKHYTVLKPFIILLFLGCHCVAFSQQLNQTLVEDQKGELIMIGYCDRSGIENGLMADDFHMFYHSYALNEELALQSSNKLKELDISIIFGSWCSDSREQLPRIFRFLDAAGFPSERLMLLAVDRTKTAPGIDIGHLHVERVPTIILYHNGREIGRIIETPMETIEADIAVILSGYFK